MGALQNAGTAILIKETIENGKRLSRSRRYRWVTPETAAIMLNNEMKIQNT
jgi:hypothetical protein